MGNRFSDIRRGGELNEALTNYISHLRDMTTRQTKRQRGGTVDRTREANIKVDLTPFGIDMPDLVPQYTVTASGKGLGAGSPLSTILNDRVDKVLAPTSEEISPEEFRPAKITLFVGTGARSYEQSKVTKLYYIKYVGETYTAPFGAKTEAEEYKDALRDIRADIRTNLPSARFLRISFKPEIIN